MIKRVLKLAVSLAVAILLTPIVGLLFLFGYALVVKSSPDFAWAVFVVAFLVSWSASYQGLFGSDG